METQPKPILTGKEGAEWDLDLSASWTKNFRDKHPGEIISHFFGREILEKILAQDGCVGLRFYNAIDPQGKPHLIIAGASADGQDQVTTGVVSADAATGGKLKPVQVKLHAVAQQSAPCPGSPGCPKSALSGIEQ
jgi:hypothetical protein